MRFSQLIPTPEPSHCPYRCSGSDAECGCARAAVIGTAFATASAGNPAAGGPLFLPPPAGAGYYTRKPASFDPERGCARAAAIGTVSRPREPCELLDESRPANLPSSFLFRNPAASGPLFLPSLLGAGYWGSEDVEPVGNDPGCFLPSISIGSVVRPSSFLPSFLQTFPFLIHLHRPPPAFKHHTGRSPTSAPAAPMAWISSDATLGCQSRLFARLPCNLGSRNTPENPDSHLPQLYSSTGLNPAFWTYQEFPVPQKVKFARWHLGCAHHPPTHPSAITAAFGTFPSTPDDHYHPCHPFLPTSNAVCIENRPESPTPDHSPAVPAPVIENRLVPGSHLVQS
ncbi:hypothetical protein BJ322DRAFT_1016703 [Thelephora terrestris]|uniref:Uncharacterized protein n=1 Tax=Thelephora terrestris TaxID=56493 RepID=A0A9P6HR28_9AGAM|nr:hypothetical protein BJ322DRAFT_1016703 [Thelephora terrestris]